MNSLNKVTVVGGAVMDHVYQIPVIPNWGQAVQASTCEELPGGKGLNQAVAASRLGAQTTLIGEIGKDSDGDTIKKALLAEKVDTQFLKMVENERTPSTVVLVGNDGKPAYIGWMNADGIRYDNQQLVDARNSIIHSAVLALTLEPPLKFLEYAVHLAHEGGAFVILNASPPLEKGAQNKIGSLLRSADLIVLTQWEASQLVTSMPTQRNILSPEALAVEISALGAKRCCVLADDLCCVIGEDGHWRRVPGYRALLLDSSGGSDAFCGTVAANIAKDGRSKDSLETAIHSGVAAMVYSVEIFGAMPSMPTAANIDNVRRSRLEAVRDKGLPPSVIRTRQLFRIRGVIIDYEDTLVGNRGPRSQALVKALADLGFHVSLEDIFVHYGKPFEELIKAVAPSIDYRKFLHHYSGTLKQYPATLQTGSVELLSLLKKQNIPTVIVSPGSRTLVEQDILSTDLNGKYESLFASEDVEKQFPDSGALKLPIQYLTRLGVSSEEIVYIGDSVTDLTVAAGCGIHFIAVLTGASKATDFQAKGLSQECIVDYLTLLLEENSILQKALTT